MKKLTRDFYNRDTILVAKSLLGKYLIHQVNDIEYVGKIVEVEAYIGPHDLACHSAKGLTNRTRVMFGAPGHAYIYLIYGMYHCLNIVTEPEGNACAVLIRAIEPIKNIQSRTQGPGLLCKAMHIDMNCNGEDLLGSKLYLTEKTISSRMTIVKRPRIGVPYAEHWAKRLLRFYIKDNSYVSKP